MKKKNNINGEAKAGVENKMDMRSYEEIQVQRQEMNVIGWKNAMDCANDIWCSIHSSLLSGKLVFAFKETRVNSDFRQVVITQSVSDPLDFAIGMITTGYSMLLPHVPFEYLSTIVVDDFKKYKVDSNIQEIYKQVISEFNPEKA